MLSYRNVRRRAEERVCAREQPAREKRQADLRAQNQERKRRAQRIADGTLLVRQPTLAEYTKKRRVIHEPSYSYPDGCATYDASWLVKSLLPNGCRAKLEGQRPTSKKKTRAGGGGEWECEYRRYERE
jgi:hypothetical protein